MKNSFVNLLPTAGLFTSLSSPKARRQSINSYQLGTLTATLTVFYKNILYSKFVLVILVNMIRYRTEQNTNKSRNVANT